MGILGKNYDEFGNALDEWSLSSPKWVHDIEVIRPENALSGTFILNTYRDGKLISEYRSEWPQGKAAVPVDLYCWLTQHPEYGVQWLRMLKPMKV